MSTVGVLYADQPWWKARQYQRDTFELLWSHYERIKNRQTNRLDNTRRLIGIYEYGYRAAEHHDRNDPPLQEAVLAYNYAKNAVDTGLAKTCKSKIEPMVMSEGGSYQQRKEAKDRTRAILAEFTACDVETLKWDVARDAFVTSHGAGLAYVGVRHGRVCIEQVWPEEIFVDDVEGRYRTPRSIYRARRIDRFVAMDLYGEPDGDLEGSARERREKILNAPVFQDKGTPNTEHDMIEIVEAWHLPSGPDAGDGRYCVVLQNCTLQDVEWTRDRFPFAKYCPRPRMRGFWGQSWMMDIAPAQREHEKITARLQKAVQKMAGTHIIAPRSAGISERQIDNDQGTYFEYDGTVPPTTFNPEPFNPLTLQYRDGVIQDMFKSRGVSEYAAQSRVPAGLQQASGKALQLFEDQDDERMLPEHRELERWTVDLANLIVDCWRELVEQDEAGEYELQFRDKRSVERFKLKDIVPSSGVQLNIVVFPVSMLARSPAAKFAQLSDMLKMGAINLEQFKRLFEVPDLEAENAYASADTDVIDWALDRIALAGEFVAPEPFWKLDLAIERTRQFIEICTVHEIPQARMDMLHEFQDALVDARNMAMPPPAPSPAPSPDGRVPAPMPPLPPGAMGPPGAAPPGMPPPGIPPS